MLNIIVTVVFVLATVAALLSLADSALVAREVAAALARERALARLGFITQMTALELRHRCATRRPAGQISEGPVRYRALPLRFAAPGADAA
jgi:hypothetical protein